MGDDCTSDPKSQYKNFLTECQILANLRCENIRDKEYRKWLERLREICYYRRDINEHVDGDEELDELLDSLAFLLVRKPEESVALALVGLTRDNIEIVGKACDEGQGWLVSDSDSGGHDQCLDESMHRHAQRIFELVKEDTTLIPGVPRDQEIFVELVKLQIDYSIDKLWDRVSRLKIFIDKVEGFELPSWVSLEKPENEDRFSIPPLLERIEENPRKDIHVKLCEQFKLENGSVSLPPMEDMKVLDRRNFDVWTKIFLHFFRKLREEVERLNTKNYQLDEEKRIRNFVACYVSEMEGLVTESQSFRRWVEITTRTLDEQKKQLEEEKKARESILTEPEQPQSEATQAPVEDPGLGGDVEAETQVEELHQLQEDIVPEAQSGSETVAPVADSMELTMNPTSGPMTGSRKRDWLKMTMEKVVPASIVNHLTPKPRGPLPHVRGGAGVSSQPPSEGNKEESQKPQGAGEYSSESSIGCHESGSHSRPISAAPKSAGHITCEESRTSQIGLAEGLQLKSPTEGSEASRVNMQKDIENFFILGGDPDEEGYGVEVDAATISQSTDFNIFWLIPQHIMAIKSILGSVLVPWFTYNRDLSLKFLPHDEGEEPTRLPCNPLRETLYHILPDYFDRDTVRDEKVNGFLTYIKAHEGLVALDAEFPMVKASGHAELLLLSYFRKLKLAAGYPHPYIGTSRPPCFICEAIILSERLCSVSIQKGHGHVYVSKIPRGIPRGDTELDEDFQGVEQILLRFMRSRILGTGGGRDLQEVSGECTSGGFGLYERMGGLIAPMALV
ncbi:hypothetical protein TWF102_005668 [Orbilia oligospora]|uniref:Uncharacterized protein n=1 Tax=Orbilia oligospora TaxID=2813651 RepID=A0A7C8JGU1_ORBOL|nr:hypothetical protein TWF102_005668 [Orbilia oligospora]